MWKIQKNKIRTDPGKRRFVEDLIEENLFIRWIRSLQASASLGSKLNIRATFAKGVIRIKLTEPIPEMTKHDQALVNRVDAKLNRFFFEEAHLRARDMKDFRELAEWPDSLSINLLVKHSDAQICSVTSAMRMCKRADKNRLIEAMIPEIQEIWINQQKKLASQAHILSRSVSKGFPDVTLEAFEKSLREAGRLIDHAGDNTPFCMVISKYV